ncbi:MAG: hypothetical protein BroJett015_07530 [Chloroflexota bacterium]|nr:MAG: hypothetical protein BroJett015_07530 [Chloroflexota bacterium]
MLHQEHGAKKHELDHIVPRKHGGSDDTDNLAWTCFQCNRYKGSEVAAYDPETGQLIALFNPRTQQWHEHFLVESGAIMPLTAVARVTIFVLQINRPGRIMVRQLLAQTGIYP